MGSGEGNYRIRVAFQVSIRPDSYEVGGKTIMASHIDPKIPDNELEWFTKRRCVTVLVGLLVKIEGLEEVSMPIQQVIANTQTAIPQTAPTPQVTLQPEPAKKEPERREPAPTPQTPMVKTQSSSSRPYPDKTRQSQPASSTCNLF